MKSLKVRHIPSLDGLRGIAATLVVIHHAALAYGQGALTRLIGAPTWNIVDHWGHNAVILFFCLSGFVLQWAMPQSARHYRLYGFRRVLRLYPALFVAITASIAIRALSAQSVDPATALRHYLVLGVSLDDISYDYPIWSLVYEARFSIVFPLMAVACIRWPRAFLVGCTMLYAAATLASIARGIGFPFMVGFGLANSVLLTLLYLPIFGFGMTLAHLYRKTGWTIPLRLELPLTIAAILVFCLVRDQFLVALAGLVVVYAAISAYAVVLQSTVVQFLARVSYSWYLTHMIVLSGVTMAFGKVLPMSMILLIFLGISLLAGWAVQKFVEGPANDWARAFTQTWRHKTVALAAG